MSQPTRNCPTCNTPLPGVAAYCYVCGTETPAGINRETGERVAVTRSSIGPVALRSKLQRALGPGYELQDRIGAGGFAEVFKARDLRLKRDLAVKVLRPDLGLSPDLLQRFRREAETIAALRHPNIVPVYDVGEAEGLAYIIMPLIQGESLRAILDRDGAMPIPEVRRILRDAASGLADAHDAGVVHRDLKPENIMLEGKDKRVLLMDFGIAKIVGAASGDEGDPAEALTTTGIIIGTPQYMSPEQACGDKTIDARTDQYSLAVVGYRMLSGVLPFEGESTRAVLYKQLVADPSPITEKVPELPGPMATAVQRAMAKEPAERFESMREFAAMLAAETTMAAPPAPAKAPSRRTSPLAVFLLLIVVGLAGMLWYSSHTESALSTADNLTVPTTPGASEAPVAAAGEAGNVVADPKAPAPKGGKSPAGGTDAAALARGAKGSVTNGSGSGNTASPAPASANTASCSKAYDTSDWFNAATVCAREAEGGNATAQRLLGNMYDKGNGVQEDPAKAVDWYRRAAPSDPEAKYLLSHMIEIGRGTPQNDGLAIALLREAGATGMLKAQLMLAFRFENGGGVKKDESEAGLWYRRAAEQGDVGAMTKLGEFLAKGRGIPKNEAEALTWYKKAADKGSAESAWQAAQMYFKGKGTDKDEAAGMVYLKLAAAKNLPDAVKELKKRTS
ncbi:MAG: serine/threonine-protein kinase [Gemmatimonadota bacterium]